jgi:DNA-binding response OmpR family regulator
LTAFAREQCKALALAAGFNLHITKPIDIAALVRCVNALAKRTRQSNERMVREGARRTLLERNRQ